MPSTLSGRLIFVADSAAKYAEALAVFQTHPSASNLLENESLLTLEFDYLVTEG